MKSELFSLLFECLFLFVLALSPVAIVASIVSGMLDRPSHALIVVEGLCCEFTAQAAQRELASIGGVIDFKPDYRTQAIRLELRRNQPTSPKAIWEAVERTPLRPVRLVTKAGTFNERPYE